MKHRQYVRKISNNICQGKQEEEKRENKKHRFTRGPIFRIVTFTENKSITLLFAYQKAVI